MQGEFRGVEQHLTAPFVTRGTSSQPADHALNKVSLEYKYEDLVSCTSGFNQQNLLGRGTYGSVYSGKLQSGTQVAIKVLRNPRQAGFNEEVKVLSKFRHPNLVILFGFARNGPERLLVYEYLGGGDLSFRLHGDAYVGGPKGSRDPVIGFGYPLGVANEHPRHLYLSYRQRIRICLDAALGLSYLVGSKPSVFHRDIKAQNILLDARLGAKVGDFGLACLVEPNERSFSVSQCSGTIGYADPQYVASMTVTEATECYSFGMLLLEVLTNKPPALICPRTKQVTLNFACLPEEPYILGEFVEKATTEPECGKWPFDVAQQFAQLAYSCVQSASAERPTFQTIVKLLRQIHEAGKRPAQARRSAQLRSAHERFGGADEEFRNSQVGDGPVGNSLSRVSRTHSKQSTDHQDACQYLGENSPVNRTPRNVQSSSFEKVKLPLITNGGIGQR